MKTEPILKTEPIVIEGFFNASIGKVWRAITDKDQMKEWYFDIEEFKTEPGFEFHFYGGDDNHRYLHLCKIIEAIPAKKLSYSWEYENDPNISFVTFELSDEGEKTRIKLIHEGVDGFENQNPDFKRESFVAGWTSIIGKNLKEFVEKQ